MIEDIDWKMLIDDESDDHIPEVVITPSAKSKRAVQTEKEDVDSVQMEIDSELKCTVSKPKDYTPTSGHKVNGKGLGLKINSTFRNCDAEFNRRNKVHGDKDGLESEETIQLSDQSDDGASCSKDRRDQKSVALSTFARLFFKKFDERNENAFKEEFSFVNPRQGRKSGQNRLLLNSGRFSKQSSSRTKPFQSPAALVDSRKHNISNSDKKVCHDDGVSLHRFYKIRTPAPQHKPLTDLNPNLPSSYHVVDEDMEDAYAEKLSDCMKDVKVYYPSRDDRDLVEVIYTDMECLAPEAFLSSTIMNFYIRYLQQSSSSNKICNYHFFNTYFYNKLQKLNYREDSFRKFRKWWKGVNLFDKAYILLPVHESAHWSLGIICMPSVEEECGPIVLHLDSLGLHDSGLIFGHIKRFLREELRYLRSSEDPSENPIMGEVWENLDDRIIDRKILVPRQTNSYDCGLFVLYYMECFIKDAPERLAEKDLAMFGKQWFEPAEASNLRWRIHNLLVQEFKTAKDREASLSPK